MAAKVNDDSLRKILQDDAAPLIASIADTIAARTEQIAGTINGNPIRVIRDDEVGDNRARSAIIVTHVTDAGRQAARDAAMAALQAGA